MNRRVLQRAVGCVIAVLAGLSISTALAQHAYDPSPLGDSDPGYFPIGVWAQSPQPSRIAAYSAAGFNLFVSISWDETDAGLTRIRNAGMKAIVHQNAFTLSHTWDPAIFGWLMKDEPDNAQQNPSGGWYSPIPPFDDTPWNTNPPGTLSMWTRYQNAKANDPTRPVFLNLGMGVAYPPYVGRGSRANHPEDYADYIQCSDIISFDIYPVASDIPDVDNKIWLVADGVDRLVSLARPGQPVWNFVECTDIHGTGVATPAQVKAEVWMSLIHGSTGILYFVHEFEPFQEPGLLDEPEMLAAVTDINWQIRELAPVLNSPTVTGAVSVMTSSPIVPIHAMVKRYGDITYIFALAMRNGPTTGTFTSLGFPPFSVAEVIGEDREIPINAWSFNDPFDAYEVHLYRILSRWPGDADGDGDVDLDDFTRLKNNFGLAAGAKWDQGDFDRDGDVDLDDFTRLKNNFGIDTTP
ncbi:MAG: hypothetical protein GX591_15055 [Planctomycetes bacterium]|nr:hypothetical protein [Planctomycetota bacterium]